MSEKFIKWLYKELPQLVAQGILTPETSEKIQQYYREKRAANKSSVTRIICGTLGALLIGLGVNLLLAHNWEQLSRSTRAVISIAPLILGQALALYVLYKRPKSGPLKEGTAAFLSLMVGASIALIAQTYHIPGDTGAFVLTWMLLILPLVYLLQASVPAALYLIGMTVWTASQWDFPLQAILFWPLAGLVIPHFIWTLRQDMYKIRATLLSFVLMICVTFAAMFSLGRTWPGSWIITLSSLYAIYYYVGNMRFPGLTTNWQQPLRGISAVGLFLLAFWLTSSFAWQECDRMPYGMDIDFLDVRAFPDHLLTLALLSTAALLFYGKIKKRDFASLLFGVVPLLALICYVLRDPADIFPRFLFNMYLVILSVDRVALGIRDNHLRTVNLGMLMLAIVIAARFFDSEINFILKGLIFIGVGIGFLAMNVWLMRRKGAT